MGTIIRAAFAYWLLLLVVRIIGRRRSQMTPFELILMFLIGGMTIQAVVADDRSMTNAALAVITVGMMHVLVGWLKQRFVAFRKFADGTPVVILERGHWLRDRMDHLRMQEQDVMAAAREQGVEQVSQIRYAIVERDGSISIIKEQGRPSPQDSKAA